MSAAGKEDDFLSQLNWSKKSSRQDLEDDKHVKELLTSDYLFDEQLNETIEELLNHKQSIQKAVGLWEGDEVEEQLDQFEDSSFFELLGVFISDAFHELRDIEYEDPKELNNVFFLQ